jgi:hypothetical protein
MIDWILSVIPEKYRRDVTLLVVGGAVAVMGYTLDGKINAAYAAATTTQELQKQILAAQTRQHDTDERVKAIESNQAATKAEIDMLVTKLIGAQASPASNSTPNPKP